MRTTTALLIAALLVPIGGCNFLGQSEESEKDSIIPGSGGSASADAEVGGGAGGTLPGCVGAAGPAMAEVSSPNGTKYCIDRTEVTQKDYQTFLKQVSANPGSEHADCSGNISYQPEQYPSSMESQGCKIGSTWTPDTTPNQPVQCVDWCDAVAYCKWAGKRLCGKVGGGRLDATGAADADDPAFDPNVSQWYNACSQGGKTLYPYGDIYDPLACEGRDAAQAPDGGVLPKKDVGARAGCRGSTDPFASIRDMSGSVREMTDECFWSPTMGANLCNVRGGTRETAEKITCKSYATWPSLAGVGVGFRCCKEP